MWESREISVQNFQMAYTEENLTLLFQIFLKPISIPLKYYLQTNSRKIKPCIIQNEQTQIFYEHRLKDIGLTSRNGGDFREVVSTKFCKFV